MVSYAQLRKRHRRCDQLLKQSYTISWRRGSLVNISGIFGIWYVASTYFAEPAEIPYDRLLTLKDRMHRSHLGPTPFNYIKSAAPRWQPSRDISDTDMEAGVRRFGSISTRQKGTNSHSHTPSRSMRLFRILTLTHLDMARLHSSLLLLLLRRNTGNISLKSFLCSRACPLLADHA